MPTQTSAELNNRAISHLQAGQVQEAMRQLLIALSNVSNRPIPREFEPQADNGNKVEERRISCSPSNDSCSVGVFGSALSLGVQDSSYLLRYDRALYIDTRSPAMDDSIVSAVILFNTAQVHHSIGLECDNLDVLEQASRLYCMALVVMERSNKRRNHLLLLAIFNNMAHIDSHLCRMGDMMGSLGKIRSLLREDTFCDDNSVINENDMRVFTMNAMFDERLVLKIACAA
jgi:hypothetical protein